MECSWLTTLLLFSMHLDFYSSNYQSDDWEILIPSFLLAQWNILTSRLNAKWKLAVLLVNSTFLFCKTNVIRQITNLYLNTANNTTSMHCMFTRILSNNPTENTAKDSTTLRPTSAAFFGINTFFLQRFSRLGL